MALKISIALLLTLFTAGKSLRCYNCTGVGFCQGTETTCGVGASKCLSATLAQNMGNTKVNMQSKACGMAQNCLNGSVNFGITRTSVSMQCCDKDLCNNQNVPDMSSDKPNGKQCFTCDEKNCLKRLDCLGNEDYCITAKVTSEGFSGSMKGCVSKTVCDVESKLTQGMMDISCCQGNLCNGSESFTHNFLLLSWLLFSYILFH